MPKMSFAEFNKSFSAKTPKTYPIYCFAGEEGYFIDSCLKKVQTLFASDDLNREVFQGKDAVADDIFNALQTVPFFGSKRIIIVKELNKMLANTDSAVKLTEYISNPVDTAVLLLAYLGNSTKDTSDKRKSLINKCSKDENCLFVECKKLYENTIRTFINEEFKSRGKTASYGAVSMLIEENGVDMLNIVNEIEKAALFVGQKQKSISEQDIEMISGYTKEANIFNLSNAIEAKDGSKSLDILDKLLAQGTLPPPRILSNIMATVRKLLMAKSLLEEKHKPQSEIISILRLSTHYAPAYFSNLRKHSLKRLKESLIKLLEMDGALKSASDKISPLQKAILFITDDKVISV
ncbi:MAG: DNA polymerase III subunit delta [Elusimicrobiota bacterium]|jgi:DNA polymerase-3 subunit delta|nr:DNA polymerase III subunit delta [Elusimicrobiota bacterium]